MMQAGKGLGTRKLNYILKVLAGILSRDHSEMGIATLTILTPNPSFESLAMFFIQTFSFC